MPTTNGSQPSLRIPGLLCGAVCFLVMALSMGSTAMADPVSISYTATQISGTEWQYSYQVSGSYLSGDDLAVYFPQATDSNLVDLGTGGPDWTTFVFQPDPSLPADGEFDMVANSDNPSLAPFFDVQFQWTGTGSPGAQSFTLFDPNFNVIDSGYTEPTLTAVPEPAPFLLMGFGMMGLWLLTKRQRYTLRFNQTRQ